LVENVVKVDVVINVEKSCGCKKLNVVKIVGFSLLTYFNIYNTFNSTKKS